MNPLERELGIRIIVPYIKGVASRKLFAQAARSENGHDIRGCQSFILSDAHSIQKENALLHGSHGKLTIDLQNIKNTQQVQEISMIEAE